MKENNKHESGRCDCTRPEAHDSSQSGSIGASGVILLVGVVLVSVGALAVVGAGVGIAGDPIDGSNTVSSCTTITTSGTYTLDTTVVYNGTNSCIAINASDVVLDGQGHTIQGPGDSASDTVGVEVFEGPQNVTIRAVTVTEFETNVEAIRLTDGRIENVTATDADTSSFSNRRIGIDIGSSDDVRIEGVEASKNGFGLYVGESSNLTVTDSTFLDNRNGNVFFESVVGSTVSGVNASLSNFGSGVFANTSSSLRIEDSVLEANSDAGVSLQGTSASVVENVTAIDNHDGVFLNWDSITEIKSTNNLVANNTLRDNNDYGIRVQDTSDNTVRNNTVRNNPAGIVVRTFDDEPIATTVSNVTVDGNTVTEGIVGIRVSGRWRARYDSEPATVSNVTLRDNRVENNSNHGVTLDSTTGVTMRGTSISGSEQNLVIQEYTVEGPAHSLDHYRHDIDTSNTVGGRPIQYRRAVGDETIGAGTNAGFVGVVDSANVTVEDLSLRNNSHGVLVVGTANATVENVTTGVTDKGIEFLSTDNSTIAGTEHDRSSEWGIVVTDFSDGNTIRDNSLNQTASGDTGIYVWNDSDDNHVHDNTVFYAPSERDQYTNGIQIGSDSDRNRVTDNTLLGTEIRVTAGVGVEPHRTEIRRNVARNSTTDEAIADRGTTTTIVDNRILDHKGSRSNADAILADEDSLVRNNTVIDGSGDGINPIGPDAEVRNNTVRNVGGSGIEIGGFAHRATVTNNSVRDTRLYGVWIRGPDNATVANNTIVNRTASFLESGGVYDEGTGSVVRDNLIRERTAGLLLAGDGDYGRLSNNTIRESRIGVREIVEDAENYSVDDTVVRNSTTWAYENEYTRFGESDGWTGTVVSNLSLSNAGVSFTNREAALSVADRPDACDPAGRRSLGVFFDTTNTSANAWLDLTVHYGDVAGQGVNESSITLYRHGSSGWSRLSTARDQQRETVRANVTSFGRIGLFANGTAECPSGLAPLSATETLPNGRVDPAIADHLRVETSVRPNATAQLLTRTLEEYRLDLDVLGGARNVTFYLNASELRGAFGDLSPLTLSVDGVTQPYYPDSTDGQTWLGFEIDHFSNRTVSFYNHTHFDVSILGTNAPVEEGDALEATAEITNRGNGTDTQGVGLSIDGTVVNTTTLSLAANSTETVTLGYDTGPGDAPRVDVGVSSAVDKDAGTASVSSNGTHFEVPAIDTSGPVPQGDPLDVTATIENAGTAQGSQIVTLDVNGSSAGTRTVNLGVGATRTLTFTVGTRPLDPGVYELDVRTANGNGTTTAEIEHSVVTYANESGIVEIGGVFDAVDDWRDDIVGTIRLLDVIDAWRSGKPV